MPRPSLARSANLGLEEFLRHPRIDERPYLEYYGDRIGRKVSPYAKHSVITKDMVVRLDQFARPRRLGESYPELRCTFGGRSIVPDVVFLLRDHRPMDEAGGVVNASRLTPDIQIEIVSPDPSLRKTREKLSHAISHGCPLGWLIHPERNWIEVYRAGQEPERLAEDG
ncbi:MAG: Uma2 family endonuclease [Isosphaeraceae bacterium]